MPQLAPVNWLFLFILFWFTISLVSALVWWSSKLEYKVDNGSDDNQTSLGPSMPGHAASSWDW
uniref:ATP synthase complex subunit 8 n=1 Tax=Rochia nilotica TaxID=2709805 RepID=A0A6G9IFA3_9VEST|nr:ATP synthase subunit 8 [Rochia nilotica]